MAMIRSTRAKTLGQEVTPIIPLAVAVVNNFMAITTFSRVVVDSQEELLVGNGLDSPMVDERLVNRAYHALRFQTNTYTLSLANGHSGRLVFLGRQMSLGCRARRTWWYHRSTSSTNLGDAGPRDIFICLRYREVTYTYVYTSKAVADTPFNTA